MALDLEIIQRLDHLVKRWHELKRFGVQRIGLDETIHFNREDREEIEKLCEESGLDQDIYLKLYNDWVEMEKNKKDITEKIRQLQERFGKEGSKCVLRIRIEEGEVTQFHTPKKCSDCDGYSSSIICEDYVDVNHLIAYYKRFL
jgi:hypothetical protein